MLFRFPVLMENSYNFSIVLIIILQSSLQNTLMFRQKWCYFFNIKGVKNMSYQNDCLNHCGLHCQKPTLGKMMKFIIRDALHLHGLLSSVLLSQPHKQSPGKDSAPIYNSLFYFLTCPQFIYRVSCSVADHSHVEETILKDHSPKTSIPNFSQYITSTLREN